MKIAFIGYNERQTNARFIELAACNADQVKLTDWRRGRIVLFDGTEIIRVSSDPVFLHGRYFDQVIIADDRRLAILFRRGPELRALEMCCARSEVPEEFRWQFFDLDAAEVPD